MCISGRFQQLRLAPHITAGFAVVLIGLLTGPGCARHSYDVVVYGGTAGGVIAAVSAANEGLEVALLEPGRHIGGMVTGGLGRTDFGRKETIGGMSREFFEHVGQHYGEPITWYFEPHVASKVFHDWLDKAGVDVYLQHRLDRVAMSGIRIQRITIENGASFTAPMFIDASYEGDLMARAGVSYTWGREGQDQYGESLAGVREHTPKHQFDVRVSAYDEDGDLLPLIQGTDPGRPGQADRKVQAYNFRICFCKRKDNQVPFPKPGDYDPKRYELLRRYIEAADIQHITQVMHIGMMPNEKTDVNNNGPISTDHIGGSWGYPEADYAERQRIWDDHVSYVQGFFYYLANDPAVPKHLRDEMNEWGLAADEFVDTGHWPHQLYIREARRMTGAYVMTQQDLQDDRTKPDSIGMGSYNSDSHNVQRVVTPDGAATNEGDMQVPVQPYEIAYRALTPKRDECGNLLVVGTVSASHVAYSSIRMEPVYMIMGHAAGVAASHASKRELAVQDVPIDWLQQRLHEQDQILSLNDITPPHANSKKLPGIVVDNRQAVLTGPWHTSTSVVPFIDTDYLHDGNEHKGECAVRFAPGSSGKAFHPGQYEVRIAYTANSNRATNVPVIINASDGPRTVVLNQRQRPEDPPFQSAGTFQFNDTETAWVEIRTGDTDGHVVADAVQWLRRPAREGTR